MIPEGTYKAKVVSARWGMRKGQGDNGDEPTVDVEFELTSGEYAGEVMMWQGSLSRKRPPQRSPDKVVRMFQEYTVDSLKLMGWPEGSKKLDMVVGYQASVSVKEFTRKDRTVDSSIKYINDPNYTRPQSKKVEDVDAFFADVFMREPGDDDDSCPFGGGK